MTAARDLTRLVRSWLQEDRHEDASRVLDLVLDQLDSTPQRRAGWLARRFPMNYTAKFALTAAVVVVLAAIGIGVFLQKDASVGPSVPTPSPSARSLPEAGPLEPGIYEMPASVAGVAFEFTVPAGWATDKDDFVSKHMKGNDEIAFSAWQVTHLFTNACHPDQGQVVEVGPTVDDLANALATQKGRRASGPTDTDIDGYPAKRIELAPRSSSSTCDEPLRVWAGVGGDTGSGWRSFTGQTDVIYVVDAGGRRLVINTWHLAGATEADVTELEGILASIRFSK